MIKLVKEYRLELASLPFEPEDGKVYFISSGINPAADHFVEDNYEEIRKIFAQNRLEFIFIPHHIGKDLNGRDVPPTVLSYAASQKTDTGIAFSAYHLDLGRDETGQVLLGQLCEVAWAYSCRDTVSNIDYSLNPETRKMMDQMVLLGRAMKLKGVKLSDLGPVFGIWIEPRGLVVKSDGSIVLPNYNNLQINLNPLEKALYLFLLQHPEGVEADALVGYRKDLLRIYHHFTIFGDESTIENSIDNLLSEDKGALYSHISKLNSKIDAQLADSLAKPYRIQSRRQAGVSRYLIDVPFDSIRWERQF